MRSTIPPEISRLAVAGMILSIVAFLLALPRLGAAPAAPGLHEMRQPDGTTFLVRLHGDEFFNWIDTADGRPVLQDPKTGVWTYALPAPTGVGASSGVVVGSGPPPGLPWTPVAPPVDEATKKDRFPRASVPTRATRMARGQGSLPVNSNTAVLLTTWSHPTTGAAISATYTPAQFETLFFDISDPDAYSFANLFRQMSYGQHIPTSGPAGIQNWAQAPNTHDYYGGGTTVSGSNRENGSRVRELVTWRVGNADATMDFGPYDTDNDGFVDLVCIVYQGTGQANSGQINDIWPIRWTLATDYVTGDKNAENETVKIRDFIVIPELNPPETSNPTPMTTIGLMAHEYGHGIGWPDLYDQPQATGSTTEPDSNGLGNWCLMSGGNYNRAPGGRQGDRPCWANAELRWECGWLAPEVPVSNTLAYGLGEAKTQNRAVRLTKNGSSLSEYYLLEYRRKTGFDVGLPGEGLLIWHVDTAVTSNENEWWNISTTDRRIASGHYHIALEQADGLFQLEKRQNSGDAADAFTAAKDFIDSTVPSSRNYANQVTNVGVRNISTDGDVLRADLYVNADNQFPTVQFTTPADGVTNYVTVPNLQGTASDNVGVQKVVVALRRNGGGSSGEEWYNWNTNTFDTGGYDAANHEKVATGTTSWFVNVVVGRITPGSYTEFAKAIDTSGANSEWKYIGWSVVPDANGPNILFASPASDADLNSQGLPNFTGSVANWTGDSTKRFVLEKISETPGQAGSYFVWGSNTFGAPGAFGGEHQLDQFNNSNSWSVGLAGRGLGRGRYAMWARLYTTDARESPWQRRPFRIDYPPTVAVVTPAHNAALTTLSAISGTCLEPTGTGAQGGGVRLTLVDSLGRYWNGSAWSSSQAVLTAPITGSTWAFDSVPTGPDLPPGLYNISASLTTNTGESASPVPGVNQIAFRVDTSPPNLTIATPPNGATLTAPLLPGFSGQVSDPSGVAWVNCFIRRQTDQAYWTGHSWSQDDFEAAGDAQPSPTVAFLTASFPSGGGSWTCTSSLPRPGFDLLSGTYNFIVMAGDAAGNYTQVDSVVVIDFHPTFTWTGEYGSDWDQPWNWRDDLGGYVPRPPGTGDIARVPNGTVDSPESRTLHALRLEGGTLNASPNAAAPSTFTFQSTASTWTAGWIAGNFVLAPGSTLSLTTPNQHWLGTSARFVNHGTVIQEADASIGGYDSTLVENRFDGTWRIVGAGDPFNNYYGGNVFKSDGIVEKTGTGTANLNDWRFEMPGETRSTAGVLEFNSPSFFITGSLFSGAGTIRWNGPMDLQGSLTQNVAVLEMTDGALATSGSATIVGTWEWEGGWINNQLTIPTGSTLKIQGDATKWIGSASRILNSGTIAWSGPGPIGGYDASRIVNGPDGRFEALTGGDIVNNYYGGNVFQNDGLLIKTGDAAALHLDDWRLENTGEIRSNVGAIETHLDLSLATGSKLSGTGTQRWKAGTVTATGTMNLTAPLELDGATLAASGPLAFTGDWTWLSGWIQGALDISTGKKLTVSGAGEHWLATSTAVRNAGTVRWTGPAPIGGYDSIRWNNQAGSRFEIAADGDCFNAYYGSHLFTNDGIVAKTDGTGLATINDWAVNNSNEIRADSGQLDVTTDIHWLAGTKLRGPGTIRQRWHTWIDGPTVLEAPTQFFEGTVTASPAGSLTGTAEWVSGVVEGTLKIVGGSTFRIVTGAKTLATGAVIQNSGLVDWQSGDLQGYDSILVENLSGSTLRLSSPGTLTNYYGGNRIHISPGAQLQKTGATTSHVAWAIDIDGTATVQQGVLSMEGGGSSAGAYASNAGAELTFAGGDFTLKTGASVLGTGLNRVAAAGVYADGPATGRFRLDGGTLGGTGTGVLTLLGANEWLGGSLNGQVVVDAAASFVLSTGSGKTMNTTSGLTNNGILEIQAPSFLQGYDSVQIVNNASGAFRLSGDIAPFTNYYGGNGIVNHGVLEKTAGTGAAAIANWTLQNHGTLRSGSGNLEIATSATLAAGSHIGGPGRIRLATGSLTVQGTSTVDSGVFEHAGGLLAGHPDGSGRLNAAASASIEWTGGDLGGTLTFGGSSTLPGTANRTLGTSSILKNAGTMTIGPISLTGYDSSQLQNLAGATLRLTPGLSFANYYSGNSLVNHGTVELTAAGTVSASPWAFSQSATGALRVPIAAAGAGVTSAVLATGSCTLAGSIVAVVPTGLTPPPGATFYPVTWSGQSGTFASVLASTGDSWTATYEANRLAVKIAAALGFDSWATAAGLTGANALPGADPDGDGLSNYLEYALGLSPTAPSSSGRPGTTLTPTKHLSLSFSRREPSDVTYVVENPFLPAPGNIVALLAPGAAAWTGTATVTETGTGATRSVTVVDPATTTSSRNRFLRIRIVGPTP